MHFIMLGQKKEYNVCFRVFLFMNLWYPRHKKNPSGDLWDRVKITYVNSIQNTVYELTKKELSVDFMKKLRTTPP